MLKQYYNDYTEEEVEAAYDEYAEYDMEMAEEEPAAAKSPVAMAFILVPILDLVNYKQADDWIGKQHSLTKTDKWKNVKSSALAGGVGKLVLVAGFMAGAVPMTMGMPIKGLSAIHELVTILLINKAQNETYNDKHKTNFAMAISGAVISVAAAMASKPAPAEEEVAEEYYEEEGEEETEEATDDGYYGYY